MHGAWSEVAERVLVGRYRFYDQDIGAVIGRDGVVVIDTRTTEPQGREILEDLGALTGLPIRWFVNTHWHYDHTFGNAVMRPAEGWGHEACPVGMLAHGERMRSRVRTEQPGIADDLAQVRIDPPERTFADHATIDLGGRAVELAWLGRGHTDADIVVRVPDAGVLFAGDLLENGAPPQFGDSHPLEWPETVARMLPLVGGPVVPGHGDVADRAFLERELAAFRDLASLARTAVGEGLAVDDVMAEAPWDGGPIVRVGLERAISDARADAGGSAHSG